MLLAIALGGALSSCVHQHCTALTSFFGCVERPEKPLWANWSIKFPQFYAQEPITVGADGGLFRLDGPTLQALQIAANDYLPPREGKRHCLDTQVGQEYRVIRQGDIIFVRIDENPKYCGGYLSLDSGADYAISVDGGILRRVIGIEPMDEPTEADYLPPDGGIHGGRIESRDARRAPRAGELLAGMGNRCSALPADD